jgi:thiamine biosynthesis lipoprotein
MRGIKMNRRQFLQTSLGLGAVAVLGTAVLPRWQSPGTEEVLAQHWHERRLLALGTVLSLKLNHPDRHHAEQALDAGVAAIRHIESQMSLFQPDSAVSQLNRTGRLDSPDADLLKILQLAQQISHRSHGAFDVTVQPLWQAFDHAREAGRLPTQREVSEAHRRVGWRGLDIAAGQLSFRQAGMSITLNGIAQGYAADRVRESLAQYGIEHALINTGEWTSLGKPAPSRDWTLGIASPQDEAHIISRVAMQGRSLATSADNQTYFSADHRHHHIFDPKTGYSPDGLSSVTVAAASCAWADALTKVMFVSGFEGALRLASDWNVDVLVVDKQGRWAATPGMSLT